MWGLPWLTNLQLGAISAERSDKVPYNNRIPTRLTGKRSILLTAICGVAAGLLVALFSDLPHGGLWSFSWFSSATLGFWIWTTSTLVLLSSQRLIGAINGFVYVGTMFFVTGIYKEIRNFLGIYSQYTSVGDMIMHAIPSTAIYAVIPAIICGILAAVLWSGRRNSWTGKILLITPACLIAAEAAIMYGCVFTEHTMLFQALLDTACLIAYIAVFSRAIAQKPTKQEPA